MNSEKIKCVIELGSTKVRCVIAQINDNSIINVLAYSTVQSKGIHNGVVVNPLEAAKVIRSCLSEAESKANIVLKKINILLEIPEFVCTRLSKYKKIDGSIIHKDDVVFLLKEAKKEVSLNDLKKTIIHIFNHNYIVDGKKLDKEPINVYADFLSHEMTFITIPKNIIKNLNLVFVDCDVEIERFISNTFAEAVNCLSDTDFQLGATLIDIGFEKTSMGIFKNFALIHSTTFPIGINHVTKDISRVCSLSLEESENIRNQLGCHYSENDISNDKENNLAEKFFKDSKFRKITKSLLSEIIMARIKDILGIIKKEIYFTGLGMTSGQNIFITGGGSNLSYLKELCSNFFGTNIKIIGPSKNKVNLKKIDNNIADSCYGALNIIYHGWETEAIPETVDKKGKKHGFFRKILGIGV